MDKEKPIGATLEELRKYLEFQREMGVEALSAGGGKKRHPGVEAPAADPGAGSTPAEPSPGTASPSEQMDLLGEAEPRKSLEEIREELGECTRCRLSESRTNLVFGEGNPKARIVFVGEGPGADEDAQGRPFVGRAGQLLNRIIGAMGFKREDVYICNVVKSRPPQNRSPLPDEIRACEPFLFAQLRSIEPEVVICLGGTAAHSVLRLKKKESIGSLRRRVFHCGKSKVLATYHPAALLRNPNLKKPLWEDMKMALREIGLKPPAE